MSGNIPERVLENAKIEGVEDIIKVKDADARDIPFPENNFDAVGSVFVIHNIRNNREKAIIEMIRVLKPGGTLVIAEVGGILYWLKYNIFPELLKDKILKDYRFKRYLLNKIIVANKYNKI